MQTLKTRLPHNLIGVLASTLCLIHCLATPFLFVVQAEIANHGESHPEWWGILDLVFLAISFAAVWWSAKNTSKSWMRFSLCISWALLALIVFNEKISLFPLAEQAIYVPTIALISLHLYNRKYCGCEGDECCTHK